MRVERGKSEMNGQSYGVGFLLRIIRNVGLAISLIRDYWRGSYRAVPANSLLAITLALLYIFSPLDFIPDVLPVIGLVDDALVAFVCFSLVEKDLRAYEEWRGRADRER